MNIEKFRKYCLSIKGSEESISLQNRNVLVCKVMGKVFVYIPLEPGEGVFKAYLKCDPDRSVELREKYKGINPDKLIEELVDHSVDEVIKKLSTPKSKEQFKRHIQVQLLKLQPFYSLHYIPPAFAKK